MYQIIQIKSNNQSYINGSFASAPAAGARRQQPFLLNSNKSAKFELPP